MLHKLVFHRVKLWMGILGCRAAIAILQRLLLKKTFLFSNDAPAVLVEHPDYGWVSEDHPSGAAASERQDSPWYTSHYLALTQGVEGIDYYSLYDHFIEFRFQSKQSRF